VRCCRCQFENIPGQERCLRCGSVLEAKDDAVDIHPPRMAPWKGPVRSVLRQLHLNTVLSEIEVPAFLKIMSGNALLGLIQSIIPGLAHVIEGRFHEVRLFVLGWFLAALAGIFFFGGSLGFLFLGLAVGLHGWIAFSHALSKEHQGLQRNLADFVMLLVVIGLFYWGVQAVAFGDFVLGNTNLTIPYQNIQVGDTLLARRSGVSSNDILRGSLVVGRFPAVGNYILATSRYDAIGQVVALPGEKVEIRGGKFCVNGKALDADKFPVPRWMSDVGLSEIVAGDSYFVSTDYNVAGNGGNAISSLLSRVCMLKNSDITAVVVMRWLPVWRRGFLKEDQ
jgi:hypothetical protein